MTGRMDKRLKPTEEAPSSGTQSIPIQKPQQKEGGITSTASNDENMIPTNSRDTIASGSPSKTLDEAPSSRKIFKFNSPQALTIDFKYQAKASTTASCDTDKKVKAKSNHETKTNFQAESTLGAGMHRQASPGVNVALEDAILLDDSYTLPRGPKSSTKSSSMSQSDQLPVAPNKKVVKFVMPYRDESTQSSFDNTTTQSRDTLQTKSYIEVSRKKKKSNFATLEVVDRAGVKSKECLLTPSALVELQQLKLRVTENDEQLNSIEEQLIDIAQAVQNLQERVRTSEVENIKLRREFSALKNQKALNNNETDDEDDESEKRMWSIQRMCYVLIAFMLLYLAVAYWAT
ncbi:hypothetical protein TWF102_004102 [Orbilia oligospora]|uniref:Uncharacterized protein n=1 Tax=Orbilia oligospora TaxID=2813651 RepID=A0A7C8JDA0_ORBOL|nr:hypothetical protein TWF102_004102 [Orbilia oligospora]KAF3117629.1 hypothetical protein TWF103_004314 [Orbilia oligospora]KAF3142852.1 hypothetical protein TWF703_000356 [Orbilia oligospora]KAF3152081.1 hypothetical protein TWF594_005833 [Orbilia oligospora]